MLAKAEPMSHEEQIALIRQYKESGDVSIRNKVIETNYRHIYSVVRRFRHPQFELEEILSFAVTGFAKAIDRYDLESGFAITTYANSWMHDEISKNIRDTGFTIRLPANQYNDLRKALNTEEYRSGDELSFENQMLYSVSSAPMSFDAPMGEDGKLTIQDVVASDADTMSHTTTRSMRSRLMRSIGTLPKNEQIIVKSLFGIDSEVSTLQEAGAMIGVSYERARQLRNRALSRLKKLHPDLKEELV